MELTHLSLFSGIGGLDIAAERAGFTTVGQCEWADYPRKVLAYHWPDIPRWRDIRTLTKESFYEQTGLRTVDIISGGFPCQPFSTAGQRRGKEDDRYLCPEMLRICAELQPAWVIGENVAGLVSMAEPTTPFRVESRTVARYPEADHYEAVLSRQEKMLLDGICKDLEGIGYEVQPFVIPACGVGANHQRYRIAIVGWNANGHAQGKVREIQAPHIEPCGICADVENAHSGGFREPGICGKRQGRAQAIGTGEDVAHAERNGCCGTGQTPSRRRHADQVNPTISKSADVPHPDSQPCGSRRPEPAGQQREAGLTGGGYDVANTEGAGIQRCVLQPAAQQADKQREGQPDAEGSEDHATHAPGERCEKGRELREHPTERPACGGKDASYTHIEGGNGRIGNRDAPGRTGSSDGMRRPTEPGMGCMADGLSCGLADHWAIEPDIPRLAKDVPERVDMLKALGNAVVWQQFYPFFAYIAKIICLLRRHPYGQEAENPLL